MSFIIPINVLQIQEELKKYKQLCDEYEHTPAKKEFEDIVNFILLHSGTSGDIFESKIDEYTLNYLYEDFSYKLNEARGDSRHLETDGEGEWDTAVDHAVGISKKIIGGLVIGATLATVYIAFLFKKGKLKSSLDNEKKIEMEKLSAFKKVIDVAIKVSKAKNEPPPKLTDVIYPSTAEQPPMPEKPDSPESFSKATGFGEDEEETQKRR
jgi:hypothetical protein